MLKFKTKEIEESFKKVSPILQKIVLEMNNWSMTFDNSPIVITEAVTTLEHDKAVNRKSSTHREGRAVDIRCNDWKPEKLADFLILFDAKYRRYGAVVSEGKRRFVVAHGEGMNLHIHAQIGRDIKENKNVTSNRR